MMPLMNRECLMGQEVVRAAKVFIKETSNLPPYERDQIWAEALHYAQLEEWNKIPSPVRAWFRQIVAYIDDDGPQPEYWPKAMPWQT